VTLIHLPRYFLLLYRANELFAFQGLPARARKKAEIPDSIKDWASLPPNTRLASIKTSSQGTSQDDSTLSRQDGGPYSGSVLVVSDTSQYAHTFLDGGYSLGALHSKYNISSLYLAPDTPILLCTQQYASASGGNCVTLVPAKLKLPLLNSPTGRQIAELSSCLRELIWHTLRVVKDMRETWYGTDARPGARSIAPRWLRALEERQRKYTSQFTSSCL
jgi:anaphase-promoting complex subunit 4